MVVMSTNHLSKQAPKWVQQTIANNVVTLMTEKNIRENIVGAHYH